MLKRWWGQKYAKSPGILPYLRLNTEALIYRVIANETHWIGERLFIVFAGRGGSIIDRCYLLAPLR